MTILNYTEHSPTRKTLEIEVPAEQVEKVFDAIVHAYSRRANIPGFRKGHAPASVVAKRFATEIREEVIEHILPAALEEAIEEKRLETVGRPLVESVRYESGVPLVFTAQVDVKPPIALPDYFGVPVTDERTEPTDEEIGTVLDRMRESHAEFLPIEGRPARDGDYGIVDVAGQFVRILEPGQNPETFRDEKLLLEVGHPDSMPEINEALRGLMPGQSQRFRKTFSADFPNDRFKGQTVDYEVTLVELKEKKLPDLDEEFARHIADAQSLAALRERVAEGLRREKRDSRRRRLRRAILDNLLTRTSIEPPEVLVQAEIESSLRDYASYVAASGGDPNGVDWMVLQQEVRPAARRRVQEYLLLDAIARKEGIGVSETEVEARIRELATRNSADFSSVKERLVSSGRISGVREELRIGKVVDRLIENAQILPSGEPVVVE